MKHLERDFNLTKSNPNKEDSISACIVSARKKDMFGAQVQVQIKVLHQSHADYDIIYDAVYNGISKDNIVDKVYEINALNNAEIDCIFSFLDDKFALELFRDYLKKINYENYLQETVVEPVKVINPNNYEEYDIKIERDDNPGFTGFFTKQSKSEQGYEKNICIKKDLVWESIYYGVFSYEHGVMEEMSRATSDEEIESILSLIGYNETAVKDVQFYVSKQKGTTEELNNKSL